MHRQAIDAATTIIIKPTLIIEQKFKGTKQIDIQ